MANIFPIAKGLFNRSTWESKILAGKGFAHFVDGDLLCFMMLPEKTRLHVVGLDLGRASLTEMVDDQTKPPSPIELVIAGMFQGDRSESELLGHAYTGVGAKVRGTKTRDTRGSLVFMSSVRALGASGWGLGLGDTAAAMTVSDIDAGFTGLIPMIDTPLGGPVKTFEKDEMFQAASPNGRGVGRTIVAMCRDELLLAVVQPEGAFGRAMGFGLTLPQLMNKLVDAGADEAVGLDGSDSVFVKFHGSYMLRPGGRKNRRNITATGFSFIP